MFVIEMALFAAFIVLLTLSASYPVVVIALVGIGLALGCDYPTAHLVISESILSHIRGWMVLSAFGFQALGGLAGTIVGFVILSENPDLGAWRWMYASTLLLAVPVTIARFFVVQSPLWLVHQGRVDEAEAATEAPAARSALSERGHPGARAAWHRPAAFPGVGVLVRAVQGPESQAEHPGF